MPAPRSSYRYTTTVIGDCGHLVDGWPVISDIGGSNPRVICDPCTEALYGEGETSGVWVRVQPEKKPKKASKPKKEPKPKVKAPWDVFLDGDG